jgi:hypothetical protein
MKGASSLAPSSILQSRTIGAPPAAEDCIDEGSDDLPGLRPSPEKMCERIFSVDFHREVTRVFHR